MRRPSQVFPVLNCFHLLALSENKYNAQLRSECLSKSFGVVTILQQEVLRAYAYLNSGSMDDKDQKRICNTLTIIRSLVVDPSIASQFLDCTLRWEDPNGIAFIVFMMLPLIENTHKSFDSIRKLCLTVVLEISMSSYDNSVGLGRKHSCLVQTGSHRSIYLFPLSELFQDRGETWTDGRPFPFNPYT